MRFFEREFEFSVAMPSHRRIPIAKASVLVVVALLLAACGGGEEETAAVNPPPPPPPPGNQAPTISGSPSTTVMQGQSYSFTPSANDANGDSLTFSITNKPGWATFSASTGLLSGTPTAANVGNYSNIQISVSDGQASANLAAFSISVVAVASGSATLSWNAPTTNTDGSALTDLAGYKIYWGTAQGNYPNQRTLSGVGVQTYVVDQLTPATWFFVVTAYDTAGNESTYSNTAQKTVM